MRKLSDYSGRQHEKQALYHYHVYTADLKLTEDTVFDVAYQGHVNTVEIKDHKIHVKDADCPDQTCVKMGWLSSSSMPIVCLPHKMVIEFTDGSDVDAVTR